MTATRQRGLGDRFVAAQEGIAEEGGVEEGQPGQGVRDAQAPGRPGRCVGRARPTTSR